MTPGNIENIQKMVIPVIGWDFLNNNLTACSTTYIVLTLISKFLEGWMNMRMVVWR